MEKKLQEINELQRQLKYCQTDEATLHAQQKRIQKVSSKKIKKSKISKPKDVRNILEKNNLKIQKYMKLLKK